MVPIFDIFGVYKNFFFHSKKHFFFKQLSIGDDIEYRDNSDESWKFGYVVETAPLKIKNEGQGYFSFKRSHKHIRKPKVYL